MTDTPSLENKATSWLSEPIGPSQAFRGWLEDLNSGKETLREEFALVSLRVDRLTQQTREGLNGIPKDVVQEISPRYEVEELRYTHRDGGLEDVTGWPTLLGFVVNDKDTGQSHLPTTDKSTLDNWEKTWYKV